MKSVVAAVMAVAVAIGYIPLLAVPVHAYDFNASAVSLGSTVLLEGCNTSDARWVRFGGNNWRVIGANGNGAASEEGKVTLLAAGNLGHTSYDTSGNSSNAYADSDLRTKVDAIADSFTSREKESVAKKTLASGSYAGPDTDCVAGDPVEDAMLWPLSTKEAGQVDSYLRKADPEHQSWNSSRWWMRSPGDARYWTAFVEADGTVKPEGTFVDVGYSAGVRPAFSLDLGDILFTSTASADAGGKVSGEVGPDALTAVGMTSASAWKLTLKDSSHSKFTAHADTLASGVCTISYSGAATGRNEYISAIIADSNSDIKYYGRIKRCAEDKDASGTVNVKIAGKIKSDETLYVFNEQFNGDNKTDHASNLVSCSPEYTWADDNSSVTAVSTMPDGSVVTETVNTTSKVTMPPHCERKGETTYTAEFSNPAFTTQTRTVANIEAYGHNWGAITYTWNEENTSVSASHVCRRDPTHREGETVAVTKTDVEPSCETIGYIEYKATFTKAAFSEQIKRIKTDEALGHEWDNWTTVTEPTATTAGEEKRVCERDGSHVETRVIPPTTHDHAMTFVSAEAASCEHSGHKAYYECTLCHAWYKDSQGTTQVSGSDVLIPAKGHMGGEPEMGPETEATCSSTGGYTLTTKCKTCGKVLRTEYVTYPIAPDAHVWGDWAVTTPATESAEGVEIRECTLCHVTETRAIPKVAPAPAPAVTPSEVMDYSLPAVKSIKPAKGKAKIKARWKKLSKKNRKKVNGIEIQCSSDASFAEGQTLTLTARKTAGTKNIKKLARKTNYYTRVRTYKYVDGVKHVSKWSKVKKNKTK